MERKNGVQERFEDYIIKIYQYLNGGEGETILEKGEREAPAAF